MEASGHSAVGQANGARGTRMKTPDFRTGSSTRGLLARSKLSAQVRRLPSFLVIGAGHSAFVRRVPSPSACLAVSLAVKARCMPANDAVSSCRPLHTSIHPEDQ